MPMGTVIGVTSGGWPCDELYLHVSGLVSFTWDVVGCGTATSVAPANKPSAWDWCLASDSSFMMPDAQRTTQWCHCATHTHSAISNYLSLSLSLTHPVVRREGRPKFSSVRLQRRKSQFNRNQLGIEYRRSHGAHPYRSGTLTGCTWPPAPSPRGQHGARC